MSTTAWIAWVVLLGVVVGAARLILMEIRYHAYQSLAGYNNTRDRLRDIEARVCELQDRLGVLGIKETGGEFVRDRNGEAKIHFH